MALSPRLSFSPSLNYVDQLPVTDQVPPFSHRMALDAAMKLTIPRSSLDEDGFPCPCEALSLLGWVELKKQSEES